MSFQEFITGFLGASTIEIIASVSGFACLYLLIKRNIWCWFFGFIQVSLYTSIFYHAKLYSDMGLHVVYVVLQLYGWWNWRKNNDANNELVVEQGTHTAFLLWWVVALVTAAALGLTMATYTDASFAYLDAFTTCTSLVAQFLLTRRFWYNWIFWIIVDIVAVYVYLQKGLYPTATLYVTFLIMCFFGLYQWLQQAKKQTISPIQA